MGVFVALPHKGIELSTIFNFTAIDYNDPDLPLTYQFGIINDGLHTVLCSRSLANTTQSTLPAGPMICFVQVFDSYGVYSESTKVVIVSKELDQQRLQEAILNQLHETTGNSVMIQNTLAVVSAVLNSASCQNAPICDNLNRMECHTIANTCGTCKSGFIGDAGNSNNVCISLNRITNSSSIGDIIDCRRDIDCSLFEVCDITQRKCRLPSKACPNDCSTQGFCSFINVNTHLKTEVCKVTDVSCQAKCSCYGNFTGSDCGITTQQLMKRQELRNTMLNGLSSIVSTTTNINSDNLGSLSDTLSSISRNPDEVTTKMADTICQVALKILSTAVDSNLTINYQSLSGILSSVNTVMQVSTINSQSIQTLQLFSDLVSNQLVPGENIVDYIYDSFRIKVISVVYKNDGTDIQITAPQSEMESLFASQSTSSITIQRNKEFLKSEQTDLSISMIVTTVSAYGNFSSQMNNNPVQLKLSSKSNIENNTSIIFHLNHNSEIEFTYLTSSHVKRYGFNTTCSGNLDNSIHYYTCPQSNEILIHKCNGQYGILTSYCKVLVPSCSLLNSYGEIDKSSSFTNTICTVLDYTKTSTICQCTIQTIQSKRRLENIAMNGVVNLVSTSSYVASDIKDTFLSSGNLNSIDSIQHVLIVIIMFSVLWVSGLLLLFCCMWRQRQQQYYSNKKKILLNIKLSTLKTL
jgi:hypothetical protein